jgi:hypothetical protein
MLLSAMLVGTSHARLTEKENELVARFGKVELRDPEITSIQGRTYNIGTNLHFRSEHWRITALLIDDRCARITYRKIGDWTDEQIVGLLDRNGGAGTYKEEQNRLGKSYRTWKQVNGVTAVFRLNTLTLTHPLYERRLALLKAKADAESKRPPKF